MKKFRFRKNAEIGKLEAETDSFLNDCFYETDVYRGIINFDDSSNNPDFTRRIIVGRTGSGKTALLKHIIQNEKIKVHEKVEAENTVFEHIVNNVFISRLIERKIDLRVFYKSLWLHILLVNIIQQLHRSTYESFFDKVHALIPYSKKSYNAKLANDYLEEYKDKFFSDEIIEEITNKIQGDLESKLGAEALLGSVSGSLSTESTQKIQRETSSYVSRELLRKQKELIKVLKEEFSNERQVRIVISIDDLDKSWLSASEIRYDFINALLEAFKELLDIRSVKVLISIRTDIIMGIYRNSLRQEEKDESLIYAVSWNMHEIKELVNKRINFLVKNQYESSKEISIDDVFAFDVNGIAASDFILERTMLRPRDAISFINLCLAECDGKVELDENMVLEAEEKFYSQRKNALVKEWMTIYPHIKDYLDAISFVEDGRFHIKNVSERERENISNYLLSKNQNYENDEEHNERALDIESLVKVWFTVGVIGFVKKDNLVIYSSFQKPELDITDLSKEFTIHPLFYRK